MAKRIDSRTGIGFKMIIVVLIVAVLGVAAFLVNTYMEYQKMKALVDVDTFYQYVTVNYEDLTGLTKAEAIERLNQKLQAPLEKQKLTLDFQSEELVYPFSKFGAHYDIEAAVNEAYEHGRTGSIKERYKLVSELMYTPFNVNANYTYDEEMVKNEVKTLAAQKNIAPVDASMKRENGKFIITEDQRGLEINQEAVVSAIKETLALNKESVIVVTTSSVRANRTSEYFEKSKDLIGTYATTYKGGDANRITNMKVAASKLNNSVVYPGEIFSTNIAFGPSTAENGYKPAPTIVGGKLVDDYGGGVCQVSSTLYNAILYAELDVVERQNHSLKVGYTDYGFDATLAGDYIDLKFRDSTDNPVYIESYLTDNKVIVNLYGHEIHDSNRHLKFEKTLVETIPAPAENVTYSDTVADGVREVVTKPADGFKYKIYKLVYEGGTMVEKVPINTSTYKPRRAEVVVGTKKGVDAGTNVAKQGGAATNGVNTEELEVIPTVDQMTESASTPVNATDDKPVQPQPQKQPEKQEQPEQQKQEVQPEQPQAAQAQEDSSTISDGPIMPE